MSVEAGSHGWLFNVMGIAITATCTCMCNQIQLSYIMKYLTGAQKVKLIQEVYTVTRE